MSNKNKKFITGAEAAVMAAIDAGAQMMYGYPITPATEIFTEWIKNSKPYLQTEDEIAAGFAVCGGVLAGQKCFTATAGPGHVLMQDALSMAEAMRLPFVAIIGQRGGPSSGTVIYSQQEVILACFGGNGEGMRLVYSPCSAEELYFLMRRAFNDAWQYRFPAIVLTDGYVLKTKTIFEDTDEIKNVAPHALVAEGKNTHWQNIYVFEEDLNVEINAAQKDFHAITSEVVLSECVDTDDAEILIVAHGIIGAAAKAAVEVLRGDGVKAGLFRPITLRPFDKINLDKICGYEKAKTIAVIESSAGQLARITRDQLAPEIDTSFVYLQKPGLGIEPEEIIDFIKKI